MNIRLFPALLLPMAAAAQFSGGLEPLPERVNVQADSARTHQVIDGEWVAVGIRKAEAVQRDGTRLYEGAPSIRFTLGSDDNTLAGYAPGETKGRAELSYCYATAADFAGLPPQVYDAAQKTKTVYHRGKGICPQGTKWGYRFAVYVPAELSRDVCTIFAQWHGMPDRTLVTAPDGTVRKLPVEEFVAMYDTTIIRKDIVCAAVEETDKRGRTVRKAGAPTGWKVEQGGYPPLAFGFSEGVFYVKANSDRRRFTDKTDRCNANAVRSKLLEPVCSEFKASTIACRMPFEEFPKDCWVTFTVEVDWTRYDEATERIIEPGRLDVRMAWLNREEHIVDDARVLVGRNDEDGYYFKYGIYRVGNSTEPVSYNLAGFRQWERE